MPLTEAEANCSKNLQVGVQVCSLSFKAYIIVLLKYHMKKNCISFGQTIFNALH
jgi:hypothetical protein